jgi:hypothetical protein
VFFIQSVFVKTVRYEIWFLSQKMPCRLFNCFYYFYSSKEHVTFTTIIIKALEKNVLFKIYSNFKSCKKFHLSYYSKCSLTLRVFTNQQASSTCHLVIKLLQKLLYYYYNIIQRVQEKIRNIAFYVNVSS